jgi:hypothetical protein
MTQEATSPPRGVRSMIPCTDELPQETDVGFVTLGYNPDGWAVWAIGSCRKEIFREFCPRGFVSRAFCRKMSEDIRSPVWLRRFRLIRTVHCSWKSDTARRGRPMPKFRESLPVGDSKEQRTFRWFRALLKRANLAQSEIPRIAALHRIGIAAI